jgi:hypothetical protein
MQRCSSVKNKSSTDQCESPALTGHIFCGRHARSKIPRLWSDANRTKIERFIKVQSLYRGWRERRRLKWCGPGVLNRKDCVNDEDLVTLESKDRQYPFDYFAIEEAGRIWWFDFSTIWEWIIRSVTPLNPYTKVALAYNDLDRLRKMHLYRRRWKLPVPAPSKDLQENILRRWNVLAHIFRGFGFDDTHPQQFANLNHANLRVMFRFLLEDLQHMQKPNKRLLAVCTKGCASPYTSNHACVINALNLLTIALTENQSYDVVFLSLSALWRC